MKIRNSGRGIHRREAHGIEKLKALPDNWVAFTNLDLVLPGKGAREIDVIMVLEDRLLLVDLKDWYGPITSREGHWFNGTRDCGRSPVKKIAENVRELAQLLQRFVMDQQKRSKEPHRKLPAPWIDSAVVLTQAAERSGIADTESSRVFSIDPFIRMIRNRSQREQALGGQARHLDFTTPEWIARFERFFNVSTGLFQPGKRRYGGFLATGENPTFTHKGGVFYEFDAEEEGVSSSLGMLRRWDFTNAEVRFQTEEGRADIVGRERSVIAWLDDRSADCGNILLKPKVDDLDRSVSYWEVFERRRRTKRLSEFAGSELQRATRAERIELVRQVIAGAKTIHDLNAAHLDFGPHSIWLERPTTVKFSHLFAASFPEIQSLGKLRYQFLSSSLVPEELLDQAVEPFRKDVFLLACAAHLLIFGAEPAGEPPEWDASIDEAGDYAALHIWFERCLDIDSSQRYSNASEMLDAFNAALASLPDKRATIEGLERFKTLKNQRQIFQRFPETELLLENERVTVWTSEADAQPVVVKMWHGTAIGDVQKEASRILAFLERAESLIEAPIAGTTRIIEALWTGDAIVLVQELTEGQSFSESAAAGVFNREHAASFLVALIETVNSLHDRLHSHGDINPDNVRAKPEGNGFRPVLIDVLDFAPASDLERITPAYSPTEGGRLERDRFAVTRLAEDLMLAVGEIPVAVAASIRMCREGMPRNATLLPLREALERIDIPVESSLDDVIVVGIHGAEDGPLLADEGLYWASRRGSTLYFRGALERLAITLDVESKPVRAQRERIAQSAIQRSRHWEYESFGGAIRIDGSMNRFDGIAELLSARPELVSDVGADGGEVHGSEPGQDADSDGGVLENESGEDAISVVTGDGASGAIALDVRELWRRMIQVEAELVTEAVAVGDSAFRTGTKRHVVPLQLVAGDMDFNRNDTVLIERQDRKGQWRKTGYVDIALTSRDQLVFESWMDSERGPVCADGDRLRFQSQMENTSRQRRQQATDRILRGNSAAPALFNAFQPKLTELPTEFAYNVDAAAVSERYDLNDAQVDGFRKLIESRPLGLLQGPPGTGKTRFIGALVHYAITHGLAKNVLVASQSHEAVNNAAEAVLNLFGADRDSLSLIRVGQEGVVSETLRPFHVAAAERAYKDRLVATTTQRMGVVARALGLDQEVSDRIRFFYDSVVPVLGRISLLTADTDDAAKANSLKETIEHQLRHLDLDLDLSQLDVADVASYVNERFQSTILPRHKVTAERFEHVLQLGGDIVGSVSTRLRSFETFLAGTRHVVAGTCVGLGRTSLGLTSTVFDLVIVDEAARCTPSELAVPIQAGKWVVLVGDHAQLEPLHDVKLVTSLAREFSVPREEISQSDFQRVFESSYGQHAGCTLIKQYRMLPPIGRLVSGFYDRGLQHGRIQPVVHPSLLPADLDRALIWVDTDSLGVSGYQGAQQRIHSNSLFNVAEAEAIVTLLKRWADHDPFKEWLASQREAIGIICAYAAQRDLIWRKLQAENLPEVMRRALKVDTIDSYQGKENPIVLLSLVRNNAEGPQEHGKPTIAPGFMIRPNRINVAMSRAMDRLVIVGARRGWKVDSPMGRVSGRFDDEVLGGDAKVIDIHDILGATTPDKRDEERRRRNSRTLESQA